MHTSTAQTTISVARLTTPLGDMHIFGTPQGLLAIMLPGQPRTDGEALVRRWLGPVTFSEQTDVLTTALTRYPNTLPASAASSTSHSTCAAPPSSGASGRRSWPCRMARPAPTARSRWRSASRRRLARLARPTAPTLSHPSSPATASSAPAAPFAAMAAALRPKPACSRSNAARRTG